MRTLFAALVLLFAGNVNAATISLGMPVQFAGTGGWWVPVNIAGWSGGNFVYIGGEGDIEMTGSAVGVTDLDTPPGDYWPLSGALFYASPALGPNRYEFTATNRMSPYCEQTPASGALGYFNVLGTGTVALVPLAVVTTDCRLTPVVVTVDGTPVQVPPELSVSTGARRGFDKPTWFDLQGRTLSGKPTVRGVYLYRAKDGTVSKRVVLD